MTDQSSGDDGYTVGYGNPPKKNQFKPKTSGCPDGGHTQRKRNKQAKIDKAKEEEESVGAKVIAWFSKKHTVKVGGKKTQATVVELALMQLQEDTLVKRDPEARKLFFNIAQRNGWLDAPPPQQKGGGVLVIYSPMQIAEWEAATEGQLLTIDPLEGIPGTEGILDQPITRGRMAPDPVD